MDIAQNARKVVFCGTFDTKGARASVTPGGLRIERAGDVRKLVRRVDQITYSGSQALARGHEAVFVTERAVFELSRDGMVLTEVAPGVDVQADVLDAMDFKPLIPRAPRVMDAALFAP